MPLALPRIKGVTPAIPPTSAEQDAQWGITPAQAPPPNTPPPPAPPAPAIQEAQTQRRMAMPSLAPRPAATPTPQLPAPYSAAAATSSRSDADIAAATAIGPAAPPSFGTDPLWSFQRGPRAVPRRTATATAQGSEAGPAVEGEGGQYVGFAVPDTRLQDLARSMELDMGTVERDFAQSGKSIDDFVRTYPTETLDLRPTADQLAMMATGIESAPFALSKVVPAVLGGLGAQKAAEVAGAPPIVQAAANVAGSIVAPALTGRFVEPAFARAANNIVPPTSTPPGGGGAATPPGAPPAGGAIAPVPPAGASSAAHTLQTLFGIDAPEPRLTPVQSLMNVVRRTIGIGGSPDEPIAAGAFKVLRDGRQNIDAQASRFGAVASQIVKEGGFEFDSSGRITNLPGKPTIQDLAARLPEYEAALTPSQLQAMRDLQAETAPFADVLKGQGVEFGSRPDVQPGGFYLPRGRADLEGADAAVQGSGRGRVGGKKGFEKVSTFDSMGEGIDAGFKYAEFGDAMQSYARDAGTRALDSYLTDYFKNVTDEAGNKLASSAADRIDPALRDRVAQLRNQIAQRRQTLRNRNVRATVLGTEAERAARAAQSGEARLVTAADSVNTREAAFNPEDLHQAKSDLLQAYYEGRSLSRELGQNVERLRQANLPLTQQERELAATVDAFNAELDKADALTGRVGTTTIEAGDTPRPRQAPGSGSLPFEDNAPAQREYQQVLRQTDRLQAQMDRISNRVERFSNRVDDLTAKGDILSDMDAATREKYAEARRQERALTSQQNQLNAARRDMRLLQAEANRLSNVQGGAEARVTNAADKVFASKQDVNDLQDQFDNIAGDWEMAKKRAAQTPRGQGGIHDFSGLQGYSFPEEVAGAANRYMDSLKPPSGAGSSVLRVINGVNSLLRGLRASSDVSFMGVQGQLGAVHDPGAYGKAIAVAMKSAGDKEALGAFLRDFDKQATAQGLPTSREWAAAGLHFGGRESEFAITGQGLGNLGERVQGMPVVQQSNRMFGYFGDTLRGQMAQDMFNNPGLFASLRPGGAAASTLTGAERAAAMRQIAEASNLLTGWTRGSFGGSLGNFVQFAPRFFQSQLDLLAKAATDGSMTGDQARKALLKLVGYNTLITVGVNEYLGNNKDEGFDYMTPLKNGRLNSNFMRIRAANHDISLFGSWDSLLRGVVLTATGHPDEFARSKASPTVGVLYDLVSGKDYTGQPVGGPEVGGLNTGNGDYWLRNLLPFSLTDAARGDPTGTAIGITGIKATPMSAGENRDQAVRGEALPALKEAGVLPAGVKALDELGSGETAAVKRWLQENRPDLVNEYEAGRRQQGSIFQAAADKAKAANDGFATQTSALYSSLINGNETPDKILTLLHSYKDQLRGQQAQIYDAAYQAAVDKLPQNDMRKIEGEYFKIAGDEVTAAQQQGRTPNWDLVDLGQQRFLDNLKTQDAALAARFQKNLDERDSQVAAPAIVKLQREVDSASKDYYAILDDQKKAKDAGKTYAGPKPDDWLAAHPDVNVMRWVMYGSTMQSMTAVDQALQHQAVDPQMKAAISDPAFKREIKLTGLPRAITDTAGTQAAYEAVKKQIDFYQNKAVSQYGDQYAQRLHHKNFAQLTPSEQASVTGEIHSQVQLGTPALDAALAWFGGSATLNSRAGLEAYRALVKKYGPGYAGPGFDLKLAADAR